MMDGPPVVARPEFDIFLSDVKNERKEGEELIPMREFLKELKENMAHLRMDV